MSRHSLNLLLSSREEQARQESRFLSLFLERVLW